MIIGCDGIFDRLNNCDVLHSIWSMCNENYLGKDINEHCGKIADIIIRNCLASNANDNLTCIFVCFENFKNILFDKNNNNNIGNPNINMILANLRNITPESFSELIPDINYNYNDEREKSNSKNQHDNNNNNNHNNSQYITPGKSGISKTENKNNSQNHNLNQIHNQLHNLNHNSNNNNHNNNQNHNHNHNSNNNNHVINNYNQNNNNNINNHNNNNNIQNINNNTNNYQNNNNINNNNYTLSNSKEQKKEKKFQMTLSQHNNFEPSATKLNSTGKPKVLSPLNAKSINKYFSPTNTSLKNFNSTLINSGISNQLLSHPGNNNVNSIEEHMQTKSKFNKSTVVNNKLDLISPKNSDINKKLNIRNIHDDKFKSLPAINLNFSLKNKN
jgi:hypothetical protein